MVTYASNTLGSARDPGGFGLREGMAMNYETTITAEAADGVTTDFTGSRTLAAPAIPRWLLRKMRWTG